MISDCGGPQILCLNGEKSGALFGPAGICGPGDLLGPAGIYGHLWASVGFSGFTL